MDQRVTRRSGEAEGANKEAYDRAGCCRGEGTASGEAQLVAAGRDREAQGRRQRGERKRKACATRRAESQRRAQGVH